MARDKNNSPLTRSEKQVGFVFVRLGQDSRPEIEMLDAGSADPPFEISVKCKQVPAIAASDDIAMIYLGSNNNKGGATPWVQGLRAIGRLISIIGGPRYNDEKTVRVRVDLILPRSLEKKEITDQEVVPYRLLSNMPVVGINNYSSQVVQCVDSTDSSQNIAALLAVMESLCTGFSEKIAAILPEAAQLMKAYEGQSIRAGSWDVEPSAFGELCGLVDMEEAALRAFAALRAGLHVIFTGPPGTGKTKLAECICRTAGFASWTVPATDQWTTFETIGGYFPSPVPTGLDDSNASNTANATDPSDSSPPAQGNEGTNSGAEASLPQTTAPTYGTDRLDFLPGAIVDSISRGQCVIIDEINRADIDKAFGELFTLLAGNSVTLPFRRRSDAGFRRVRLVVDDAPPEADIDDIPVPKWWRIIGAMNDADKASLKRMSMAFIRRFAFIPVRLPERSKYEELLRARSESSRPSDEAARKTFQFVVEACITLFTNPQKGFASISMPFGPAIPLVMLAHAGTELATSPNRSSDDILGAICELYVAPQLQGRADKHDEVIGIVKAVLSPARMESFSTTLAVWTGSES